MKPTESNDAEVVGSFLETVIIVRGHLLCQRSGPAPPQFASLYVGDLHPDVTEALFSCCVQTHGNRPLVVTRSTNVMAFNLC